MSQTPSLSNPADGPTAPQRRILRAAAIVVARGNTRSGAQTAGVRPDFLKRLKGKFPQFWQAELEAARKVQADKKDRTTAERRQRLSNLRAQVKEAKESAARLERENARLAAFARWVNLADTERPGDAGKDNLTLSAFYEQFFRPVRLSEASSRTVADYRTAINRWKEITGDPPLRAITVQTLAFFRDQARARPGKQANTTASAATVRRLLTYVQAVLDLAGPPAPRKRDAAGILEQVPWIKRPAAREKNPPIIPSAILKAIYDAAAEMDVPRVAGVTPAGWWQALLIVCHNTMLRRRSLFGLRWSEIDVPNRCLRLPPERLKSKRAQTIHLNDAALAALAAIRTEREQVFCGFNDPTAFYAAFHRLLDLAGLEPQEHVLLHAIRANSAGLLWQESPAAAQMTLGHKSIETTKRHYVNGKDFTAKAIDNLPQPWKPQP